MWIVVEQGRAVRGGARARALRRFPVRGNVVEGMGNRTPAVAYELFARRPPHRRPEASGSALAHCRGVQGGGSGRACVGM